MKRKLLVFVLVTCFLIPGAVQLVVASTASYNRTAAIAEASKRVSNPTSAAQGGNANNGRAYESAGRYCATYVARTMNAGGIPISRDIQGNHQIFEYLTGKRSGTNLTLAQLAANIRQHPRVAAVHISSLPTSVRPGDAVFFGMESVNIRCGVLRLGRCNVWGAKHSVIITNERQSPIRVAYWDVEKYGVAFNDVLNSESLRGRPYLVVRFR